MAEGEMRFKTGEWYHVMYPNSSSKTFLVLEAGEAGWLLVETFDVFGRDGEMLTHEEWLNTGHFSSAMPTQKPKQRN